MVVDTSFAFNRYEQIRHRLPQALFPTQTILAQGLLEIADEFEVFLFDAFGVLNVGERCITGAPAVLRQLQLQGKQTFVVSNAGSVGKQALLKKYQQLGYEFTSEQIVTSREMMCIGLHDYSPKMRWGVAAPAWSGIEAINGDLYLLTDQADTYDEVDGMIFLGAHDWGQHRQQLAVESLLKNPRPILVGNPDLIAPRETGFTLEPGFYAHDAADKTTIDPVFFGKPFAHVFDKVKSKFTTVDSSCVVMIGDTLHTDILGGAVAGFKTILVADHGLFKGHDVNPFIKQSGIVPDYVIPTI